MARANELAIARGVATALCLVAVGGCASTDDDAALETHAAIVGDDVVDGEVPAVVNLEVRKGTDLFTCTGTLVGHRSVLTARHCIEVERGLTGCDVTAFVDLEGRGTLDASAVRYRAIRCEALETRGLSFATSDLAMIALDRDVADVEPASLVDADETARQYTVYGYGSFGKAPTVGMHCETTSDGHKRKHDYQGALAFRVGQATCPGDSGGPHFITGTTVLAGVTSSGFTMIAAYETNTAVFPHRAWILDRIAQFEAH